MSWIAGLVANPYRLAQTVLAGCRGDLGLPTEVRLEFDDLGDEWGYNDPKHQPLGSKLCRLSERLLRPEYQHLIPLVVGHEAKHVDIRLAVQEGRLPIRYLLDDDLNENTAAAYADQVACRWRTILWTQP